VPRSHAPSNISGCGIRSEQLFVQFLKSLLVENGVEKSISRETPVLTLLESISPGTLSNALASRWGEKAGVLPAQMEGLTIAGQKKKRSKFLNQPVFQV
jgi:hypothetical protein